MVHKARKVHKVRMDQDHNQLHNKVLYKDQGHKARHKTHHKIRHEILCHMNIYRHNHILNNDSSYCVILYANKKNLVYLV